MQYTIIGRNFRTNIPGTNAYVRLAQFRQIDPSVRLVVTDSRETKHQAAAEKRAA